MSHSTVQQRGLARAPRCSSRPARRNVNADGKARHRPCCRDACAAGPVQPQDTGTTGPSLCAPWRGGEVTIVTAADLTTRLRWTVPCPAEVVLPRRRVARAWLSPLHLPPVPWLSRRLDASARRCLCVFPIIFARPRLHDRLRGHGRAQASISACVESIDLRPCRTGQAGAHGLFFFMTWATLTSS